ncbi:MAG: hypothetical protein A2981_02175 [Candidatus Nealsonbacteria bacterium RIFCSPLOWO2_01_FULL_38_120]|nr:MAG: hypothetical protein A2981_02175 [Candidatus Nealsonbacteria bacterium RIFCSPLOWO2_01_FULL_38_120]
MDMLTSYSEFVAEIWRKDQKFFFYLAFRNSKYILSIYNYPARIGCAQDIADGQFSLNFQR